MSVVSASANKVLNAWKSQQHQEQETLEEIGQRIEWSQFSPTYYILEAIINPGRAFCHFVLHVTAGKHSYSALKAPTL